MRLYWWELIINASARNRTQTVFYVKEGHKARVRARKGGPIETKVASYNSWEVKGHTYTVHDIQKANRKLIVSQTLSMKDIFLQIFLCQCR